MNTRRNIHRFPGSLLALLFALPGLTGCAGSNTSGAACGNSWIDEGEQCDSIDLAGQTCSGLGFSGGTLACAADCTFDTSGCSNQQGSCGDGTINGTELCDGAALGGQSCRLLGFSGGTLACTSGCTFDTSGCSSAGCGDGVVAAPEVCDGADLAGETCQSQGFSGGTLACAAGCGAFDTSGCSSAGCGDGVINGAEVCDGAELGGHTCADLGFSGGTLACAVSCGSFDTSGCTTCGNGAREGSETCDGADLAGQSCAGLGFTGGTLACAAGCGSFDTSGCTTCGNGVREGSETCDGADLGGQSCAGLGFAGGTLTCAAGCGAFNTSGCTACSGTLLRAGWNGWDYWKVPVNGIMSDNNVAAACAACGMSVPCSGPSGCEWNGGVCVQTPNENNCGWPMQELSWWLCGGSNPDSCGALIGVYQYMGNTFISGSTCGAESGSWCAIGNNYSNRHGLCVRPAL